MQQILFEPGQTIFAEGDPSDFTYRIKVGSVDIIVSQRDGAERKVASLGPEEVFGEMGIIDPAPRSATAVAREQTACDVYTADEVIGLMSSNPEQAIDLLRTLITRLRSANRKLAAKGPPGPPTPPA